MALKGFNRNCTKQSYLRKVVQERNTCYMYSCINTIIRSPRLFFLIHHKEVLDFLHHTWENDPKSAFGFGMISNGTCPRLPTAVKQLYTKILRAHATEVMTTPYGSNLMKMISPRYASYSKENNNTLLRRNENMNIGRHSNDHQMMKLRYIPRYDNYGIPAYFFKALMDVGTSGNVEITYWQETQYNFFTISTGTTLFYLNSEELTQNGVNSWRGVTKLVSKIKGMISTKIPNAPTTFEGGMFEVLVNVNNPHAISILPCGDNYIVCNTWGNECTRANNQNSNNSQQISDDFKWSQLMGASLIFIVGQEKAKRKLNQSGNGPNRQRNNPSKLARP